MISAGAGSAMAVLGVCLIGLNIRFIDRAPQRFSREVLFLAICVVGMILLDVGLTSVGIDFGRLGG